MKRLVYYPNGRQYYWHETDTSNHSLLTISKSEFEELKPKLTLVDTTISFKEIVIFALLTVSTLIIILTAAR